MFASKKPVTLLVVTADEVMRVDGTLGVRPVIKSLVRKQRPARSPLTTAVELAIGLNSARPSRQTIVLTEEAWIGILDVDERSIYGLDGEELNQMLRFEAESQSDLDPMTSHLSTVELAPVPPDTRRFWCTGVAAETLHSVMTTVELRGGKLTQLGHPIGWSAHGEAQSWIEFRRSVAGAFSAGSAAVSGGFPRAAIAARSTTSDRWFRALGTSYGGELPAAGWITAGSDAPEAYQGELERLDSDEVVRRWAGGVLQRLLAGSARVPSVAPPMPPVSTRTLARVGSAAAVVATLACGGHFLNASQTRTSLRTQIEAIKKPADDKRQLDAQIKQLNEEVARKREEFAALQKQQRALVLVGSRGGRIAELLRLLAATRNENVVLDQIEPDQNGLRLIGRTIDADSAMQLAVRLAPQLEELGWRMRAPELQGQNRLLNGGPWSFRVELADVELPNSLSAAPDGKLSGGNEPVTVNRAPIEPSTR